MNIDLNKVISYLKGSLQDRAQMRNIMLDLFPGCTREMNVLLDIYESGIPREIKRVGSITDSQYAIYVQRIMNEYGLQEKYVTEGLDAWIELYIGVGSTSYINRPANNINSNIEFQPITHVSIMNHAVKNVVGSSADYVVEQSLQDTDKIIIKKFRGFEERELIVPNSIDGKDVVGIGPLAYKNCKIVKRLIISEGIEFVEDASFSGCLNLEEIILPSTLKRIGNMNVDRPRDEDYGAFSNTGIRHIDLPRELIHLGAYSFSSCEKLESINLPNGIKIIHKNAFSGCRMLKDVQLPDCLEEIRKAAFSYCGIEKIQMPIKVKQIDARAFASCDKLQDVQLNEGLLSIGEMAFANCKGLTKIVIPSTVNAFGKNVFGLTGYNSFNYIRNNNLTIQCYAGTKAIDYARGEGYPIENAEKRNN